jgi:hypothetical protein
VQARSVQDIQKTPERSGVFYILAKQSSLNKNYPRISIGRRDDRAGLWIHGVFSEGAQYPGVLSTEGNVLWTQTTSEGASANGKSGIIQP